jgi:hypothetical protein
VSVLSIFFHFVYPSENLKNEFTLNSLHNNPEKAYNFNNEKNKSSLEICSEIVLEEKIDSVKTNKLKTVEVKKKKASESKLKLLTKKTKVTEIVTYKIFFDGRIEKHIPKLIKKGNENKYRYLYFDRKGNKYDLGDYTVYPTQAFKGPRGKFVNLIDLEEVPKYFKKNNLQYHFNIDSKRSFINERTLGSLFGAMLEVNYLDISCNGFSHKDGSSWPSRSHINGNNADFKYLREDKTLQCGNGTSLNISKSPDSLDYRRQNKWNDALYKFGWKKMLGWTYTIKKKTKCLNHIPHKTTNHHHHLHVQNYKPQFKVIKQ